jgi:hypothetical protein
LLAASAFALLVTTAIVFVRSVLGGQLAAHVVGLLEQVLLVFMIVEILYKRTLHGEVECEGTCGAHLTGRCGDGGSRLGS